MASVIGTGFVKTYSQMEICTGYNVLIPNAISKHVCTIRITALEKLSDEDIKLGLETAVAKVASVFDSYRGLMMTPEKLAENHKTLSEKNIGYETTSSKYGCNIKFP